MGRLTLCITSQTKNLTIFIDINNLIILGKTKDCVNLEAIKDKIEGFGFDIYDVDGMM